MEKTIDVEGHRLRYLTAGKATRWCSCTAWARARASGLGCCPTLARDQPVCAIDLPGYDGSYEPPDYSPAFTASLVVSFLDAAGDERAVVVGNSFGGLVALHLALSEPARVSALVLSDSAGLGR